MIATSIPGNGGIHTKMELNNNFEDVTAFERQPYCYLQDTSVQNGDVMDDASNGGRRLHDVNNYWTKQISCFHSDVESYVGHPATANSALSTSANSSEDGLSLIEENDNSANSSGHSYKELNTTLKMTVTNEHSFSAAGDAIVFHNRLVYTPTGYSEQQQTIDFHDKCCWNQSGESSPAAMNYRYRSTYNYQDDRYCSRIHEEAYTDQPLDEDEDYASCCSKTNYYHHPSDNYPEWSSAFPETVAEEEVDPLRPRKTRDLIPIKKRNTANKKERRRTQSINNAFSELRDRIPNVPSDTKLSKIKTLRLATSYISYLMNVLKNEKVENGFEADLSSHNSARRKNNPALCYEPSKFAHSPYRLIKNYGICSVGQDNKKKGRTGWPENEWAKELKSEQV